MKTLFVAAALSALAGAAHADIPIARNVKPDYVIVLTDKACVESGRFMATGRDTATEQIKSGCWFTDGTVVLVNWGQSESPDHQVLPVGDFEKLPAFSTWPKTDVSATLPVGMPADIAEMALREDALNDKCRGGHGDEPETMAACDKREDLFNQIEKMGWCWGPWDSAGFEQHWMPCKDDPARSPKPAWFAFGVNHANCFQSNMSPADRIRMIQEYGSRAQVNDLPDGAVEVGEDIGDGKTQVFTYFRSIETCIASLPRSQPIDSRYE